MKLIDVVTSPWAIVPAKLEEIREIYLTHLRGEKIDLQAVEARIGRPLANEPKPYEVIDGVAVLPIEGVLAKRMNMMMAISGGMSMQLVQRDLRAAAADPAVNAIILHIDSPGGTVDGTQALASDVAAVAAEKRVVTLAGGLMTSAAYWIGSAANEVYIEDGTTLVGSIGVIATHVDVSRREELAGEKVTHITAGKYKAIQSPHAPLSAEGRQTMQEQVDYLYSLFVDVVANHRGVSVEQVLRDMADARIFIGQQAIDAGLVDGVSTLDKLIADLAAGYQPSKRIVATGAVAAIGAGAAPDHQPIEEGTDMEITKETLQEALAAYPEIADGFRAEGAAAERARIQAVESNAIPGHEQLVAEMKFDGKTTGPEAAQRILQAEKAARETKLSAIAADGRALNVPNAVAPQGDDEAARRTAESLPVDERCKLAWDRDAELRAEFRDNFGAYVAAEKALASGRARILRK